jgi:hypothetical protein
MRKVLMGAMGLMAFSITVWSAELWNTKPVREWTREETQQFLRESPWAHQVVVAGSLLDTGTLEDMAGERAGQGEMSGAEGGTRPASVDVPISRPTGVTYVVEWSSARIIQQVGAHFSALQNQRKEEETVLRPTPMYVLTVTGSNLRAFGAISEDQLKAGSYLRPKHAKAKVEPVEVKVRKAADGRILAIQFAFPRQMAGQPLISDQEKSVEFGCKVKDRSLKTTFHLAKMTTPQGRDL